jgi:hypothetical protein
LAGQALCSPVHKRSAFTTAISRNIAKNFVAFFPIWDILFGTYYHPARDEFPPTGVEGEKEIQFGKRRFSLYANGGRCSALDIGAYPIPIP